MFLVNHERLVESAFNLAFKLAFIGVQLTDTVSKKMEMNCDNSIVTKLSK